MYFSDYFNVDPEKLAEYGAFNVSLVADLPLFIDPFLIFNSDDPEYQKLHQDIIAYLQFLRARASKTRGDKGELKHLYTFKEVKQNWFGFTAVGNGGSGLGPKFANALNLNLNRIFTDFGNEKITRGSHLEKLCLIQEGVGKDGISDFTTNMVKEFLLKYTEDFAKENIDPKYLSKFSVEKVRFNYKTQTWESKTFKLPKYEGDFVILTPSNILTKDDTWVNRSDLISDFDIVTSSIENDELRFKINNYFNNLLAPYIKDDKEPSSDEISAATTKTLHNFPELIDYFIKYKEDHGEQAVSISNAKVKESDKMYVENFKNLIGLLNTETDFYKIKDGSFEESLKRVNFLKDVIENKGGHKLFYSDGKPIKREEDIHIMYRITWYDTKAVVTREANDGRGPADFKVSKGNTDKTIVEFKLASNTQLKKNLAKQTDIYKKASDAKTSIKAIVYFSEKELDKVRGILNDLGLTGKRNIVLIDARNDNKPSGSKA
ncbi:MAG: hypothetical protein PHU23_15565 [Dehalococcoidales bacterium]|nr:hypothetical protein [Dehalococcoidales bacterium]